MAKEAVAKVLVTVGPNSWIVVNEEAPLNGWETAVDEAVDALLGHEPGFEGEGTLTNNSVDIDLYATGVTQATSQPVRQLLAAKAFSFTIPSMVIGVIKLAEMVYATIAVVTADILVQDVATQTLPGSTLPLAGGGASSIG